VEKLGGSEEKTSAEQMKSLFTVMDTEKGVAETFNTHAVDSISMLQSEYSDLAEMPENGGVPKEALDAAQKAGRISHTMGDGLEAAVADLDDDERSELAEEYRNNGMKYQAGKSVLTTAIGFAPGGSVINGGIDAVSPAFEAQEGEPTGDEGDRVERAIMERVYAGKPGSDQAYANFANGLDPDDPLRDAIEQKYGRDVFDENGDIKKDISNDRINDIGLELEDERGPIMTEYYRLFNNSENDPTW